MAEDAYALLEYLDVEKAHIVGMSMGGMIAQIMAAKYPDTVMTLTSIMSSSGSANLPMGTVKIGSSSTSAASRQEVIMNSANARMQIDGNVAELTEKQWQTIAARGYDRSYYPEGMARQLWAIMDSGDRINELKSIRQPSLVIHGKADPLLPPEHGKHTAELISDSRLVLIEGMGHYIDSVNKPLVVSEIIKLIHKYNDKQAPVSRDNPNSNDTLSMPNE